MYNWIFGATTRDGDYCAKGFIAQTLCTNLSYCHNRNKIIAYFEASTNESGQLKSRLGRRNQLRATASSSSKAHMSKLASGITDIDNSKSSVKGFLAIWDDKVSSSPIVITTETLVSSASLGFTNDGGSRIDFLVLGLVDGRVLITGFPLPLKLIGLPTVMSSVSVNAFQNNNLEHAHSFVNEPQNGNSSSGNVLLEAACKTLSYHSGRVNY